jgi:hypothetical protein
VVGSKYFKAVKEASYISAVKLGCTYSAWAGHRNYSSMRNAKARDRNFVNRDREATSIIVRDRGRSWCHSHLVTLRIDTATVHTCGLLVNRYKNCGISTLLTKLLIGQILEFLKKKALNDLRLM